MSAAVDRLLKEEKAAGMDSLEVYRRFAEASVRRAVRCRLPRPDAREGQEGGGIRCAGEGDDAPELLRVGESIEYTVDRNPRKQGGSCRARGYRSSLRSSSRRRGPTMWSSSLESPQGDRSAAALRRGVGRPAGGARPPGRGAAVIFEPTPVGGAFLIEIEPVEDGAASSSHFRRRSSEPRPRPVRRAVATSPSTLGAARCAGCTSRRRPTPRPSSCAAPAARSTT